MNVNKTFSCVLPALLLLVGMPSLSGMGVAKIGDTAYSNIVEAAAGPGTNGSVALCSNGASIQLFAELGGSPETGGTWSGPAGNPGVFNPATDTPGVFTYTVAGPPSASATVTVTVYELPVAGTSGTLNTCSNGPDVDLIAELSGSPDPGGAWTLNGNPVSNMFTPGTSVAGTYKYTVNGTPPCPNATANVVVTVVAAPDAGNSASITVCSNAASFSLRSKLGGSPATGGTWSPGGSDTFVPGTSPAGVYTYVVTGTSPCVNDTSTLTITVRDAPDAGTNRTVAVCSDGAVFNLRDSLGGTPDPIGTWVGPNGPHSGQFQPSTDPAGQYTYTVAGQAPCSPATAKVTVGLRAAPNAGTNVNVVKCSNAASFTLISQLGGTPTAGGTWRGPDNQVFPSGTFIPGTTPPGAYTYTVTGQAPCTPATATVNISVTAAPNAGTNGTQTVCSSSGSFALFPLLGGTPDVGGTWTGPSGPVPTGTFVPGTSTAGTYTYRVTGTAPCTNASSTVTVTVVAAANAGSNGSVTLCSTSSNTNLFSYLGGTPSTGGVWTKPAPGGVLAGGIYKPSDATHPAGAYTYTVTGITPCPNASATVQVVENQAPNAGTNGTTTQCSTNPPFNLGTILGGVPDAGGIWLNAANATVPSQFTPGTTPAGVYRYILPGVTPCVSDTAQVTVSVNVAPVAGTNGAIIVCSDDAPVDLFSQLGGSPNAGGTWKNPSNGNNNGSFVPGPGALQGGYTYTVTGASPCANATAVVTVTQHRRPVAGTNATLPLCSTADPVNLFNSLGGTPDAGGTWTGPGGTASNGVFIATSAGTFVYKYKVTGTAPCAPDSATVTVNVTQAPFAGNNGTLTICSGQVTVDLFDALGGTPDLTGIWSEVTVTGRLSTHFFNPSTPTQLPPGNYDFRYIVAASGLCVADTALVRITIVPLLDAGNNGTKSVCNTETNVDLFTGLGGAPQAGGTWIDLGATGQVTGQFFNANGAGAGTYQFRYKLSGTLGCASDSATVTVTVTAGPNAGHEGWATFCSDGPPVSLLPYISPADGGGTWRKPAPGNEVFSGTYIPSTFAPGNYTYTVSGTAPCAAAVAVLHVGETVGPDPGTSAMTTKCASDPSFNMTALLGGTPNPTGTWTGPGGLSHTSTFVPGQDAPGVYIYTVAGTFPCVDKSSSLTVTVNPVPQAGGAATKPVCDNAPSFLLINELPGAGTGGTWFGPTMAPFPTGTYVPGQSVPGVYTYRVTGIAPCGVAEGTVTVFETTSPQAGRDTVVAFCQTGSPLVSLVTLLGGPHDLTGTWKGPAPSQAYFSGNFQPGSNAPGVYTYSVNGIPPCPADSSTVTVAVLPTPNAGLSRSISVCSSAGLIAMIDSLGGTPSLNGSWVLLPSTPSNGIFDPATAGAGTHSFRYTVQPAGNSPCAPAQATLTIIVTAAPRAGGNGNLPLCSTSGITALFPYLSGNPQSGGTWSYNGVAHGSSFNPNNPNADQAGAYTYTVQGTGGCSNATAIVTVALNQAPNAGSNGDLTICDDTLAAIVLRSVLNGSPNTGGTWTDSNGDPANEIYLPSNFGVGVHTFTYTVQGISPCPAATAQATIIQNANAEAGNDANIVICTDGSSVNLFMQLGPAANPMGTWINAAGTSAPSVFVPSDHTAGTYVYRYIVTGYAPCTNDTARVTITMNRKPRAGVSTAPQLCTNGPIIPLLGLLGGTPDNNGSWAYQPAGGSPVPHAPTFNPAVDPAGAYVYTVNGVPPCTNSSATVQITLVPEADAGTYGTMSVCVSECAVVLVNGLQGTPQAGGTWTDINASGHLSNGIFNACAVAAGVYRFRYTVAGIGPCANDTATVAVTVTPALNAGNNATVTLCSSDVLFLTPYLGGSPQPGGVWTGVESQAGLINGVLNCGIAGVGLHHYRYVLSGSSSCAPDTAILTVTIQNGPQAGNGVPRSLCSSITSFDLFTQLSAHDNNGTWYYPGTGGAMTSSIINAGVDPQGTYVYIVPAIGNCAADSAFVNVTISPAVNAGTNGSLSFCSNGAAAYLRTGLGGTPDTTGNWSFNSVQHGPVYNPLTDAPGNYVYTVPGDAVCQAATATVLVTEVPEPFAGGDNSYTFCSSDGSFNMFDKLAGNPQSGGTWRRAGTPPTSHGANYNPVVDSSGVFLYIRVGTAPCANDTARLTVTEVRAPRAGANAALNVCPTDTMVDLFAALGTNADGGGTWTDSGNTQLPDSLFDASEVTIGTYVFTYTVVGTAPCGNATATVTVNIGAGLNAGVGGNDTICGSISDYDLFQSLTGAPDPGGVWSEQIGVGAITGSILDATELVPGSVYPLVYTLDDVACGQVQSVVLMYVAPFPNPGADTTYTICTSSSPLLLGSLLTGADPGGTWIGPNGLPTDSLFVPQMDPPGIYSYLLSGNNFCSDTLARITMVVNYPADAGIDGVAQSCNEGSVELFPLLSGAVQSGGTWIDQDGSGALTGGTVDAGQLSPGQYRFRYRVQVAGCPADSSIVSLVIVEGVTVSDTVLTCNEQDRTYVVQFTISGGTPTSYVVTGGPGTLSTTAPYVFTSAPIFTSQSFSFEANDMNQCTPRVVEGVTPCVFQDEVFVPETFSPNGDGINDTFTIPGIEGYPSNSIVIFNRWGGEVYKASGYDNGRTVWDGSSVKALLPGDASTGTYYYVLDLGDSSEPLKGFIYLNR